MPVVDGSPKAKYLSKKEQLKSEYTLSPLMPAKAISSAKEAAEFHRRYELLSSIAEGSFGTVWCARDKNWVRQRRQVVKVAVKIVDHGGEDAELVQNEAEMHKKLFAGGTSSPLLVQLHDVLFEDARALLVLDLFDDGEELRRRIDAAPQGRLAESAAAPIVRQLAQALSFMHSKHVAHLDVKPENILVDSRPRLKLLDYGSACAMDRPDAPGGGLVQDIGGTDRYMAPERLALPSPSS